MMPDDSSPERTQVWAWSANGRVYGIVLDCASKTLEWFDDVGSMCGFDGGARTQSLEAFRARGAPLPHVPNCILREIEDQIHEADA
jgi:hypothetical protein